MQWNVYGHDEPRDLVDRLVRQGLRLQGRETVMVRATATAIGPGPGRDVVVRRARTEADLADFNLVQEAVWGPQFTEWTMRWFRPALRGEADPVGVFTAYSDSAPVGGAWVALPRGRSIASLFGGTVLPEFRRRGVYRALVDARVALAHASGHLFVVADANDRSAPALAPMGFSALSSRLELVLDPPPYGGRTNIHNSDASRIVDL
jgi:hypothetical protein